MMGSGKNGKIGNSSLSTIVPLVTYLASQQQPGTTISLGTLSSLNMYHDRFVDFLPNDIVTNKPQRFAVADIDVSYIDNLATELAGLLP